MILSGNNTVQIENKIETTLIGTGGGYGESIVVHLGNNHWIVIDSCINPVTNKSLPLEYLESRNVNLKEDVKLIICSHWHNDHIKGLSQLFKQCESAMFSFAMAHDRSKFLKLVGLDCRKLQDEVTATSTTELDECLKILRERKGTFKRAMADTVLLSEYKEAVKYEVISLSPSNFILDEFDKEISTLISDYGKTNRRIINQTPNDKSVVIYIKIDDQRILLGSDLEVSNDGRKGWKCIVDNCQTIDKKSQIFKLPHHGSVNGYDENVWRSLVDDNSIAKLSPYNKSSLPRKEMLQKFLNHTDCLYSTSFPSNSLKGKPKARNKQITKAIARFNKTLTEVKFQKGIVSCLFDSNSKEWEVKTLEGAGQINNHTIDNFKR